MSKVMSDIGFKLMSFTMKIFKRKKKVRRIIFKSQIKAGDFVLDYACGPGIFTIPISETIGDNGKVYAADKNPLAGKEISKISKKLDLTNIEFIQTECKLPVKENSIDVTVLFDCIHLFNNPNEILREIFRVLKTEGILSVDIHHITKDEGIKLVLDSGIYSILKNYPDSTLVLFKKKN